MINDILTMDDVDLKWKTVLLRVDLNCPIHPITRMITDVSRITRHIKTIKELAERGAKVVILTHQGDPFDELENFIVVKQHSKILTKMLGRKVRYTSRFDDLIGLNEYLTRGETYYFKITQYNVSTGVTYNPRIFTNIIYT